MPESRESLSEHPLVARASTDDEPGTTVNLIGYLGRDPEEGHWRVYYSSKLETFVRVPEGDIVATFPRDAGDGPMGRTVVTVRNASTLQQVSPLPTQVQSSFLSGPVASSMAGSGGASMTPPPEAGLATTWPCVAGVTLVLITYDITTHPPPPPTHPDTSMASCCLCWTPEPLCPTP